MNLTPKRWSEFQHYKDRSPAWIKLHRKLLDDYAYNCLPLASRALAPMLWLIASEYENGTITASTQEIAFRLRITEKDLVDALKPLIESKFFECDSAMLADCKHDASPEKENIEKRRADIRTVANATRPARDQKFEEFRKAYPQRKGGNPWKPAKAQWDSALRAGASPEQIIAAVKAGAGYDRDKIGTEYIPQAQKWLKDRRFDDHEPSNVIAIDPNKFYAAFGSDELDAWDGHMRKTRGTTLPRDNRGGWLCESRWPPGYEEKAESGGETCTGH